MTSTRKSSPTRRLKRCPERSIHIFWRPLRPLPRWLPGASASWGCTPHWRRSPQAPTWYLPPAKKTYKLNSFVHICYHISQYISKIEIIFFVNRPLYVFIVIYTHCKTMCRAIAWRLKDRGVNFYSGIARIEIYSNKIYHH